MSSSSGRVHVNMVTGKSGACGAAPGNCPLLKKDENTPHFATQKEAEAYIQEVERKNNPPFSTMSKGAASRNTNTVSLEEKYGTPLSESQGKKLVSFAEDVRKEIKGGESAALLMARGELVDATEGITAGGELTRGNIKEIHEKINHAEKTFDMRIEKYKRSNNPYAVQKHQEAKAYLGAMRNRLEDIDGGE